MTPKRKEPRVWFPGPRWAPSGASWHGELQCYVRAVRYDPARRLGSLYMDEDSCCDMDGCIAVFEEIDPEVEVIVTWAAAARDTVYRRCGGGRWAAEYDPGSGPTLEQPIEGSAPENESLRQAIIVLGAETNDARGDLNSALGSRAGLIGQNNILRRRIADLEAQLERSRRETGFAQSAVRWW